MCGPALHLLKPSLTHAQELGAGGTAGPDVEMPQVEVLRARVQQPHPAAQRQPLTSRSPGQTRIVCGASVVGAPGAWCSRHLFSRSLITRRALERHTSGRWPASRGNSRRASLKGTSPASPTRSQLMNWKVRMPCFLRTYQKPNSTDALLFLALEALPCVAETCATLLQSFEHSVCA